MAQLPLLLARDQHAAHFARAAAAALNLSFARVAADEAWPHGYQHGSDDHVPSDFWSTFASGERGRSPDLLAFGSPVAFGFEWRHGTVNVPLLAAAHGAAYSSRAPPACSRLASGPGRRAPAVWRGCGGALVPAQSHRLRRLWLSRRHFRSDDALRWVRGRIAYVPSVRAEAVRVARHLFGGEPYLAVQIRRGADRLVGFCYSNDVQRATKRRALWGWNMSMPMCFPHVEEVSAAIHAALARWHLRHVYLATDSPRSTVDLVVLAVAELATSSLGHPRVRTATL